MFPSVPDLSLEGSQHELQSSTSKTEEHHKILLENNQKGSFEKESKELFKSGRPVEDGAVSNQEAHAARSEEVSEREVVPPSVPLVASEEDQLNREQKEEKHPVSDYSGEGPLASTTPMTRNADGREEMTKDKEEDHETEVDGEEVKLKFSFSALRNLVDAPALQPEETASNAPAVEVRLLRR